MAGHEYATEQPFAKIACEKQIAMETSALVMEPADQTIECVGVPPAKL
jgi:hypothetical protein